MSHKPSRMMQNISDIHGLSRPSVGNLLGHILSATVSNATISLLIAGSAIIAFLHYYAIPSSDYFILLLTCIAILAFLNGCKAWQADLDHYQKALADARHTYNPRA